MFRSVAVALFSPLSLPIQGTTLLRKFFWERLGVGSPEPYPDSVGDLQWDPRQVAYPVCAFLLCETGNNSMLHLVVVKSENKCEDNMRVYRVWFGGSVASWLVAIVTKASVVPVHSSLPLWLMQEKAGLSLCVFLPLPQACPVTFHGHWMRK